METTKYHTCNIGLLCVILGKDQNESLIVRLKTIKLNEILYR